MVCQYCNKRLGFMQRLKGLSYCSLEHQELHFTHSFERLRDSVTEYTPNQVTPLWPANPEPARAELAVDPQTRDAAQDASPTLEITSLVGAVGTSTGGDLPEAPFLPERSARQFRPAFPLESYSGQAVSPTVQFADSLTAEAPLRSSPSLVLDVSPNRPQVEIAPITSQGTWRPVPQGYPPVIVSDSATLLLDPSEAKLIPLPMDKPCRGQPPVPPSEAAIHTPFGHPPLQHPMMLSLQPAFRASTTVTRPPQAPARDPSWIPRPGWNYAAPALTGMLHPQADVLRMVPLARHGSLDSFSSFPSFLAVPTIPVSQGEIQIAPVAHLPAALIPRKPMSKTTEKPQTASSPRAFGDSAGQFILESASPLRGDPSLGQVASTWLKTGVDDRLPRNPIVPPFAFSGLSLANDAIALRCSSATNSQPAVEIASAITSIPQFLIPSPPLQVPVPIMPFASSTRPVAAPVNEATGSFNPAYLQPSLPSPWSLVTWSQSLKISVAACQPSDVTRPAPISLAARQGHVDGLSPSSPRWRGKRLTPLKPPPNEVVWMPVAPLEASVQTLENQPISPGLEGTALPPLTAVRTQPASLPVRPQASLALAFERGAGPAAVGPSLSLKDVLRLTCVDMPHGISNIASGLRAESGMALPSLSSKRHAFSIAIAPCSPRIEWRAMPPGPPGSQVQPFSATKRSAWSITAGLPRTNEFQTDLTKVPSGQP